MIILIFLQSNQKEFLKSAIQCARTIINRNIIDNPKELMQLVSIEFNNEVSNKPELAQLPTIKLLEYLQEIEQEIYVDTDIKETKISYALRVAVHVIDTYNEKQQENETKSKRKTKFVPLTKVVIFTELETATISEKTVTKLIDEFKERNVKLYLFTTKVEFPLHENCSYDDITEAMKNELMLPENLSELRRLLIQTESLICNIKFGSSLIDVYKTGKLPLAWNVDLRIGTQIIIPVSGYKKTLGYKEPKYQYTKRKQTQAFGQNSGTTWSASNFSSALKNEPSTSYDNTTVEESAVKKLKTEESVEVHDVHDVHRTKFGEGYLTKEEKKTYKPKTERCLDLLFVMDKNEINPVHCLSGPISVLCPRNDSSVKAFKAFRGALIKQNGVGIARKCYYKNTFPKLFALIPYSDNLLQIFQVPFKDHMSDPLSFIRNKTGLWKIPTKPVNHDKDNDEIIVDEFLDALTLRDDDYTKMLPIPLQYNPKLDILHEFITERARNPDVSLLTFDLERLNIKNRQPQHIQERATNSLINLISHF